MICSRIAQLRMSHALAVLCLATLAGCAGNLKPGPYTAHKETITTPGSRMNVTLVKPAPTQPPPFLVVFASGDGGLHGASLAVLQHFADRGHWVAGFSSPEAFQDVLKTRGTPNYAAGRDTFISIIRQTKAALNLSEQTPIVISGMSRGASVVIAAAGDPSFQPRIAGAVAIALTREFDELTIPEQAKSLPGVKTDDKGRIQTYPAIQRLGALPLAIIQSTNDSYVPSAESRRLLGPDTPTRRLYEVQSRNHSFGGGQDALMRDLDDAMKWIAGLATARTAER
jgi:dienelactone hydrolase